MVTGPTAQTIECKRMPALIRQREKRRDRAFIKVGRKRHHIGYMDDPATHELYNRLKAVWERTGKLHLDMLTPLVNTSGNEITIAGLGERFRIHAETFYIDRDGQLSKEFDNFRMAWRIVRQHFGTLPAANFGPSKLKQIRHVMVRTPKKNNPNETWNRKYVNEQVNRVRRIFKWAVSEELLPVNVYEALRTARRLRPGESGVRTSRKIKPVEQERIDAIKPHVSDQVWALIQLQLLTGARSSEILKLRATDFKNNNEPVWIVEVKEHKTEHHGENHTRTLYFGPQAQGIVQPYMASRPVSAPLFSPSEAERQRRAEMHKKRKCPAHHGNSPGTNRVDDPEVSPGDHYTPCSYRRAIQRACLHVNPYPAEIRRPLTKRNEKGERVAALTPEQKREQRRHQKAWRSQHCWHPHQLRHNYATMIRRQFGLEDAKTMLDHSSIDVTLIYAERNREKAIEIARKVG